MLASYDEQDPYLVLTPSTLLDPFRHSEGFLPEQGIFLVGWGWEWGFFPLEISLEGILDHLKNLKNSHKIFYFLQTTVSTDFYWFVHFWNRYSGLDMLFLFSCYSISLNPCNYWGSGWIWNDKVLNQGPRKVSEGGSHFNCQRTNFKTSTESPPQMANFLRSINIPCPFYSPKKCRLEPAFPNTVMNLK